MRIGRITLMALLLVIGFAVTPSEASCAAYLMSTWGGGTTNIYNYVHVGSALAAAPNLQVNGSFWLQGAFGSFNNGTYPAAEWFLPYPAQCPDCWYIYANTGDGRVNGCPPGITFSNVYTEVELSDGTSTFSWVIGGIDAIYANAIVWDFSRIGVDWNVYTPPAGRLTFACVSQTTDCHIGGAVSAGTVNNLTFTPPAGIVPPPGVGYYALSSGGVPTPLGSWQLMTKLSASPTDAGTAPWTKVGTALAGQPITYSFDTATVGNQFIFFAAGAAFDGGQGGATMAAPGATVSFRPAGSTLANPKFKNIEKRHGGRK